MKNTLLGYRILLLFLVLAGGNGLKGQKAEVCVPLGHISPIVSMQLNAAGTLISVDRSGTICHWDLTKQQLIKIHSMPRPLRVGQVVAGGVALGMRPQLRPGDFGRESHALEYVNVNTGAILTCTNYEPIKELLTTTSYQFNQFSADAKYRLHPKGRRLEPICPEVARPKSLGFKSLGFLPDGESLFWVAAGQLQRWSYPDLDPMPPVTLEAFPETGPLTNEPILEIDSGKGFFYFLRNGLFCIRSSSTSGATNPVQAWETATGRRVANISLPKGSQIMDIDPTGRYALIRGFLPDFEREIAYLYSLEREEMVETYGDQRRVGFENWQEVAMLFSPDGQYVIRAEDNGDIALLPRQANTENKWLSTRARVITELGLGDEGEGIHLSTVDNGRSIATKAGDQKIFWDWTEENRLRFTDFDWMDNVDPQDPTMTGLQRRTSETFELNPPPGAPVPPPAAPASVPDSPPGSVAPNATPEPGFNEFDYEEELIEGRFNTLKLSLSENKSGNWSPLRTVTFTDQDGSLGTLETYDDEVFQGQLLAIGTEGGAVLVVSLQREEQFALLGHRDVVTDLAFSADGKRLFTASADGATKIWDLTTRKELATLMVINREDWVVLGPNNLFDASPEAMRELHYTITDASGNYEVVELEQMKDRFYDPGLLQKLLGYSDVPIRNVKGLGQVKLYPEVKTSIADKTLHIQLEPRAGGIGKVVLFANGKELAADLNPQRKTALSIDLAQYESYFLYDNQLGVMAYNTDSTLRSSLITETYVYPDGARTRGTGNTTETNQLSREDYLDARLHVICIGTSDYAEGTGSSMDLAFPDADAEMMASALKTIGCELFCVNQDISVSCLTTNPKMETGLEEKGINWAFATKENMVAAMDQVRKEARAQDVVVVYLSGHGKTYRSGGKDQFHYLTHEVSKENVGKESATKNAVLSSEELTKLLKSIPAYKQVLIIDACNSGKVIDDLAQAEKSLNSSQIRALTRMSDRTGLYLITGSAADMVSFEAGKYGQGLLTYALLKGMNSDQVLSRDEGSSYFVGVSELFEYAKNEVVELAKGINGIQRPQLNFPLRAGSFPIGLFNENTKIVLPEAKPTIVRSVFQQQDLFIDDLNLGTAVADLFREEMTYGKDAKIVYMDLASAPGAYRIGGQYTIDPATKVITLQANLILTGEAPIPLLHQRARTEPVPISGGTAEEVAAKLVRSVYKALK